MLMEDQSAVNNPTTAPLRNVAACMTLMDLTVNRDPHLPGMVVFFGRSGYGKSTAAAYVANRFRAYYVEVKSAWTKRFFLTKVLEQMGIDGGKASSPALVEMVCEQLVLSKRPLIIDEMDHVVERALVHTIYDIYNGSLAPIMLIGEETLPDKLKRWARFGGRVLEWEQAVPVGIDDARHLRRLYARRVDVADDLLEHLVAISRGDARLILANLSKIEKETLADGGTKMDRAAWGERELNTGRPNSAPGRAGKGGR